MKTEDTVEYNSLRWVKKELDLILHEAQASLSAYIEDTDETERLRECIEHLHMVQGTLQMVELYGAAQLAEEMEQVATALLNGELDRKDDAYDVLMRSMLQLPDYLESLQAGSKDVPMVLLPLLNDLRASRNATLLSENVLFFPDIDASTEDIVISDVEAGKLHGLAKKLRPHFQVGLLGWFKGEKIAASLKRIMAVLSEFEKNSAQRSIRRLWSVASALVEGLIHEGIDASISVKMLLGQVDRSIKQLIDQGEDQFSREVSSELLKNLLYYVARITTESERVNHVKEIYRLRELLPGDTELEEVRSGLGGLNTELLRTVSQGIREDLLEVKDALEIFVHSDERDVERLKSLPDLLNKIADTLSMLGLGGPREQVLEQKQRIENMVSGNVASIDDEVMTIASVLLTVEAQLNSFIANRSMSDQSGGRNRVGDLAEMPDAEYQEVLAAVIREALQDFSDARQAILGYLENNNDKELLQIVIDRLNEVNGAMFMLPVQRLKPQIDSIRNYVQRVLIGAGEVPDQGTQDHLADVVTSIEYYLEAILEGRPDLELSLNTGEKAAANLEQISAKYADVVPKASASAADDELDLQAVMDDGAEPEVRVAAEPEPVAAPTPVAEKPAGKPGQEEQRYIILGDDADPEILEIFIEEALEELASLNEQIPMWTSNPDNNDALTTVRRSFHTLKGSGRLIGAQLIGEFAWSFENMMNRVIDHTRPASQEIFDVLEEALGVLPQLIEQLKGNREPVQNVYSLIDQAEALSNWRKDAPPKAAPAARPVAEPAAPKPEPVQIPEPETPASDIEEPAFDMGNEAVGELSVDDLDLPDEDDFSFVPDDEKDLQVDAASSDDDMLEMDVSSADDAAVDNFDIDLTEDLEALQLAISPQDEEAGNIAPGLGFEDDDGDLQMIEPEPAEDEDALQIHMDPVLFKIFKGESESHLADIRRMLDEHYQGKKPLTANADLTRALHTLFGSARTAEVAEIAELCGELEKYVHLYQGQDDISIADDGVLVIEDVSNTVSRMLSQLTDAGNKLQSDIVLLNRIRNLSKALSEQQVKAAQAAAAQPVQPDVQPEAEIEVTEAATDFGAVEESLVTYSEVDEELVDIFLEEAEELLDGCENSLQRWNANNADEESVHDLQRQLHTLKGGARMADLTPIGNLTHALESLIISVNEGQISFTKDMSYILHDAMDRLSDMLSGVKNRQPISSEDRMIAAIEAMRRGETVDVKKSERSAPARAEPEQEISLEDLASIEFEENGDDETVNADDIVAIEFEEPALADDTNQAIPEISFEEDTEFEISEDDLKISATDKSEIVLERDEPVAEKTSFTLPNKKAEPTEPAEEAKSTIAHEQVRVRSDLLNELVNHAGEVSVYHARMGQQISGFAFNLSEMEQTVIRLREQLRKLTIETEAQILSRYEKESDQYDKDFDPLEMDRFSTMQQISRSLQETVGDMESIKEILNEGVRDAETLLLQESRVSSDLQEGLMRTRMVHFGGLASRLRRIVRQTARELDKDVELDIVGETSEVDRTVLDRIVAPLEHMLRNAVSHGIETPRERAQKTKPETGTIKIIVDREGGDVVIRVIDDGRGIDVNAVRKRATERGMLSADSKLSDHDILQFIMQPGFSTAEKVTQISGRGVGMDVVDSEIKQLGGVLEIDTIQGKGTTFTIRLPLTLAINHALLVSAGEEIYAVPLNSIEGVVRLSGIELQAFYDSGDRAYEFAGTQYDLRHLGYILSGQQPDYSRSGQLYPVLLAHVGDQRVAIHVDELMGRREIVVKPVGPQISSVRGISGATILGDGRVVLILDMNSLVLGDSLFHVTAGEEEQSEVVQDVPKLVAEYHEPIIMVVDDSITIRKVTERMLARHNMQVVTAKDGVDAVSQLQDIRPDVMLLDIEMPRMDGYEVASHVRNDDRLKDLPIIMITSRTGAKHREKAMEIGVNKYLGKPYQEDELMQNINELLG